VIIIVTPIEAGLEDFKKGQFSIMLEATPRDNDEARIEVRIVSMDEACLHPSWRLL